MTWACAGCKKMNTLPLHKQISIDALDEIIVTDHGQISSECPGNFEMVFLGVVVEGSNRGPQWVQDFVGSHD